MLPEEIRKFINQPVSTDVFEIEKEPIRRFADAVGETNPLYWDEEYAKKSKYGSIIAPPGFISSPWFHGRSTRREKKDSSRGDLRVVMAEAGFRRGLDGGIEYEFFQPVRAGDIIKSSSIIKDIIVREGTTGKLALVITETTFTNQKGDLIAKARGTSIRR